MAGLLSACETAQVSVSPEGYLEVFGPLAGFANGAPPPSWVARGPGETMVRATDGAEAPVLEAGAGDAPYLFVRRTRARLLATPYLSWSWDVEAAPGEVHPVRLAVGFKGGHPEGASRTRRLIAALGLGNPLPAADRRLEIVWTAKPGHQRVVARAGDVPLYAAGGGRLAAGEWRQAAIDLARVYAELWPKDNLAEVEVVYVGIAGVAAETAAKARFSDIALSK